MSMLTIPSGIKDPSYRYKMPKMKLAQVARLNGVKTNIENIEDVAEHLRVPSLAIMKYFCAELGANMEQTSLIKGKHPYDIMLKHLDKFIIKYVCCPKCNYPELRMKIEGKDLISVCNSCSNTNKHDSLHKAGKVFMNTLKAGGKQKEDIIKKDQKQANAQEDVDSEEDNKIKKKDKKDKKKKDKDNEEDDDVNEKEQAKADFSDNDDELTINSRRIAKITEQMHQLSTEKLDDADQMTTFIDDAKIDYGITDDFSFYVALVGLFPPSRNILKNWAKSQDVFVSLVKQEGQVGRDHFMQALCLYFIKKYNTELSKFAPTFMKKLVDENIMSEKFLIDWFDKTVKLDKESGLYDKKSERKFRELIEAFIEWIKNAESGSDSDSSSSGDEKNAKAPKNDDEGEEEEKDSTQDTEAQKKHREMVKKQKDAQAAAFAKHQQKVQAEEIKQAEKAAEMGNNIEDRINLNELKNEEVDIDDL